MKRTLILLVSALLLSACSTPSKRTARTHYSVVPETQVTVREKKQPQHKAYSVHPEEETISGSGSR